MVGPAWPRRAPSPQHREQALRIQKPTSPTALAFETLLQQSHLHPTLRLLRHGAPSGAAWRSKPMGWWLAVALLGAIGPLQASAAQARQQDDVVRPIVLSDRDDGMPEPTWLSAQDITEFQADWNHLEEDEGAHAQECPQDGRTCIDVLGYDLEFDFTRPGNHFRGRTTIEFQGEHEGLDFLEFDAGRNLRLLQVQFHVTPDSKQNLPFTHRDDLLRVPLLGIGPTGLPPGEPMALTVIYEAYLSDAPSQAWLAERTSEGTLRFDCALQYSGAHFVFPCKASFYHPEDTPKHTRMRFRVPEGLVAIGPGRGYSQEHAAGIRTFDFELNRPVPTWALGFALGPYEQETLQWDRAEGEPVAIEVYRIADERPASQNQAASGRRSVSSPTADQRLVAQVPTMLDTLESVFGPYPFPETRLALVETLSLSSANATWTGLRSDFFRPESAGDQGEEVERTLQHATRVLAHELGHAWWGHGLSVHSWEDIWLHESFASYGELCVLEALQGPERRDFAYQAMLGNVSPKARLRMVGRAGRSAHTASSPVLWFKGPWVLRTLQYEVGDDEVWHGALADFQERYRFQTVTTQDWVDVLSKHTEQSWSRFFEQWFEGPGYPRIRGKVQVSEHGIHLAITNHADEIRRFHVPMDLSWQEGGESRSKRILLAPGQNELFIHAQAPKEVAVAGLSEVLGIHQVRVHEPRRPR